MIDTLREAEQLLSLSLGKNSPKHVEVPIQTMNIDIAHKFAKKNLKQLTLGDKHKLQKYKGRGRSDMAILKQSAVARLAA